MREGRVKRLLILGAGIHAAEMVELVDRINRPKRIWNLLGFISKNKAEVGKKFNGKPVLGTFKKFPRGSKNSYFALSNHNKLPQNLGMASSRLVSLLDPTAFVSKTAKIGNGCILYPGCFVGLQARLEDKVFVMANSVINHDVVLEEGVIVTSGVLIAGGVRIGQNSYLGQGCTIREHLRVGRNCLIGMGAVVIRNVPSGSVVCGNPAKRIRFRRKDD